MSNCEGFAGYVGAAAGEPALVFEIEGLPARSRPAEMTDASGGVVTDWARTSDLCLAVHGQLFNVDEIARQFELPLALPPAQVLAAAWRRWGAALLQRLDGVFALVLVNGNQVLFYRDQSSLARLYVRVSADARYVEFATHLAAMVKQANPPLRLARRSLHEYLRFLDIAAPNTVYDGVIAVEAGRPCHWTPGSSVRGPAPNVEPQTWHRNPDFDCAVSQLEELLTHSVRRRLDGAYRPAAFLSGGVDSTLLCLLAARERPDLTTVTVGFDDPSFDESPIAASIAAHLGLKHQVLRFSRAQYLDAFDRLVRNLEQPMADPAMLATVLSFEYCAGHFDAVLDGTGADEAVGAMPPRHVRLAVQYGSLLPTTLRLGLGRLLKTTPSLSAYAPLVDFEHPADPMIRWHGFGRTEIEDLCGETVSFESTQFYRTFARFPRGAHFERYSALLDTMPCDRLGQATLLTGVLPRYPFNEPRTLRFLQHLPQEYRHMRGNPKRILRALLARHLPTKLWDVPKHGFDFPLQPFLAGDDYALVRRHLGTGQWCAAFGLNPSRVTDLANRFIAGDHRLRFRVWALVVLAAWLEDHAPFK